MPDGSHIPLSAEALDEAEPRALIIVVAKSRAEILAEIEALESQLATPPAA